MIEIRNIEDIKEKYSLLQLNEIKIYLKDLTLNETEKILEKLQSSFNFAFSNIEKIKAEITEFCIMQKKEYLDHAYLTFKTAVKITYDREERYIHIYYNCGKFIKRIAYSQIF